jgi:NAD(P)-dependent dehydrogenase (short-subunit alcohol dehydrogenase family)
MLEGRTIVVTGAARGVGRAIALACARRGARLVLGDVLSEPGHRTAEEIAATGAAVRYEGLDIAEPDSVERFAASIRQQERTVHGLVNNAALATRLGGTPVEQIDIELWDRVMRVNVRGTWLMTRAMLPLLEAGGDARIVNIASDTAHWGPPRQLAYVASKGAVISMTRSLARELGPRGIGITVVAPGLMRNEATESVPRERHELYETARAVPGPQVPEDIVDVVAFLLTPGALALTGQLIPVNAGFVFN